VLRGYHAGQAQSLPSTRFPAFLHGFFDREPASRFLDDIPKHLIITPEWSRDDDTPKMGDAISGWTRTKVEGKPTGNPATTASLPAAAGSFHDGDRVPARDIRRRRGGVGEEDGHRLRNSRWHSIRRD